MNKIYIFCHGFGFNSSYWDSLKPYFINKPCIYLDLGYFKQENISISYKNEFSYIGIGHSLGLIKLLQTNIPFTHIIGLNSFINFLGNDSKLSKKRSLELNLLTQSLINNTINTLESFYERCGVFNNFNNFNNLNKEQLLKDLSLLKQSYLLSNKIKTLIIGSDNDIIVPKSIIRDNFSSLPYVEQFFLKDGMHALGINSSKEIYTLIKDFINV